MSRPFLAFAWPPASDAAAAQAARLAADLLGDPRWRAAWREDGVEVWTSPERPIRVQASPAGRGMVIGRIVPRSGPRPPGRGRSAALAGEAERTACTLCDDYWGEYLALLPEPRGDRVWAFRDPSGGVDVLTWRRGGLAFAASDLHGLPSIAGPGAIRLDWNVIPTILSAPGLAADRTALNVESLAPGTMQPLGGGRDDAVALWRPADFVGKQLADADTDDLAEQLRACVEQAVDGLAGTGLISLEVSGGLDSAIVAAALVRSGRRGQVAEAVNYHAGAVLADERTWARAVCDHLDLPLRCAPRVRPPWRLEDYAELVRYARPPVNALDTPRDRLGADLARRAGAAAIFSGKGGDGVFFQRATALVLADRVANEGPRTLLGRPGRETARWLRRSIWSVGWEAARAAKAPSGRYAGGLDTHPWLQDLEALPPGKRFQVAALAAAQGHRGVNRRTLTADVVHPLLSQPVMELCLAIPSWRLVEDGGMLRGRALARRAFAEELPAEVVWRRSKGDLTTHYSQWISASRDSLLPVLRDGVLADAGLIDRDAVAEALDPDRLIYRPDARGLLSAAALELWVRRWQGRVPDLGRRRGEGRP